MDSQASTAEILPLNRAARRFGVTAKWLKAQAQAGHIPCIDADGRYLFDIVAVTRALAGMVRLQESGANA